MDALSELESLFAELEGISQLNDEQTASEEERYLQNLRAYRRCQEIEKKAKEIKEQLEEVCSEYHKAHNLPNFTDKETGIMALWYPEKVLDEERLSNMLKTANLKRTDVSTFIGFDDLWTSLPRMARAKIVDIFLEHGVVTENDIDLVMRPLNKLMSLELGISESDIKDLYKMDPNRYIFKVRDSKRKKK